jgi:hypothetical protein
MMLPRRTILTIKSESSPVYFVLSHFSPQESKTEFSIAAGKSEKWAGFQMFDRKPNAHCHGGFAMT